MADNTIIQQGYFTSDGNNKYLAVRSDIDWMHILNYTQADAANNGYGVEYRWQRGMTDGEGFIYYHPAGDQTLAIDINTDTFSLLDTSVIAPSAPIAVTAINGAAPPLVSTGDTTGLSVGEIVRLTNCVGAQQLGGIDFTIATLTPNTSFELDNMAAIVAAGAPGGNAYWRRIKYEEMYYPRHRYITGISRAAQAIVTLSVSHGYTVGQSVQFKVPEVVAGVSYGMTEINGLIGTITAIGVAGVSGSVNTMTVNIDTTGFTAFAFPLTADVPYTPAIILPVGESAEDIVGKISGDDAKYNTAYIGMELTGGTVGPGGNNGDVVYWRAGKSFNL